MNNKCWLAVALLLIVVSGGVFKFIFQGSVSQGSDGRTVIHLSVDERDFVLREMREFLASTQKITEGISKNDMKLVARSAKKVGKSAQFKTPGVLMGKLPLAFKKLGFDTHAKFDQIALDAESRGDSSRSLKQLSKILQNCVACHAGYRLEASTK